MNDKITRKMKRKKKIKNKSGEDKSSKKKNKYCREYPADTNISSLDVWNERI